MFACVQRGHCHPGMVGYGRNDMDSIQLVDSQEFLKFGKPPFYSKLVTYFVEVVFGSLANSVTLGVGVPLINGDELGPEPEPHHSYSYLLHRLFLLSNLRGFQFCCKSQNGPPNKHTGTTHLVIILAF